MKLTPALLTDRLAMFFREGIENSFCGMDWDGGDIQNLAEELGLLERVPYDPGKHSCERAAELEVSPGEPWFVICASLRPHGRPA